MPRTGSSSTRTSGDPISARASTTRCSSPPDSSESWRSPSLPAPTSAEHALDLLGLGAPPELDEARDGERDGAIDLEALRHVADDQPRLAPDGSLVGRLETQQHPHQRGLAGTVGADQRQDLALGDVDVDALQDGAPASA